MSQPEKDRPRNRRPLRPLGLLALGAAVAGIALAAATQYSLVVNGEVVNEKAVVMNGQTYVPLSTLRRLGVAATLRGSTLTLASGATVATAPSGTASPGGSTQRAATEGCIGDTLFNGVWRLTVKSVDRISRGEQVPGWGITVELRNGTRSTLALYQSGYARMDLVQPNGNTLDLDGIDVQKVTFKELPQAAGVTHQLKFYFPFDPPANEVVRPDKLLVEINTKDLWDSAKKAGVAYTTPNPSFRVRLNCSR